MRVWEGDLGGPQKGMAKVKDSTRRGWVGLALAVVGAGLVAVGASCGSRGPAAETGDKPSDLEPVVTRSAAAGSPAPKLHERSESEQAAAVALGWPNLFGPTFDSVSYETGFRAEWPDEGPPEVWRSGVGRGYASPVVSGDRLVVFHRQGNEEIVDCLDAATGQARWRFGYATAFEPQIAYSDGPYATPAIAGGRVFTFGAQGMLHGIELETGEKLWGRNLHDEYCVEPGLYAPAASPVVMGDRVIVQVGGHATGAGVVAFDAATGHPLWKATSDRPSCATPCPAVIHGRPYVFVWTAAGLVSLDPASGEEHWRIAFQPTQEAKINASSPVVVDDLVVVSGYSIGTLCVEVLPDGSGRELWRGGPRLLDSQYATMIASQGCVAAFSTVNHDFRALDAASGEVLWKWRSKLLDPNGIALCGQMILFDRHGRLALVEFDRSDLRLRSMTGRPILQRPCYSAPALSDGLLYLRNEEELVCLDLRAVGP